MAHLDVTVAPGPVKLDPAQHGPSAAELLTVAAQRTSSGAVVVAVHGEVEMTTSGMLRDRLLKHLRSTHQLIVDLSGVTLLCAAGLTALVLVRETALVTGTRLCLVARTRQVRRPLIVTGLADVFDLHSDVVGALLCSSGSGPSSPPRPRLADPRQPADVR